MNSTVDAILHKAAWEIECDRRALDPETASLFSDTSFEANTAVDNILSKVALELEEDKKVFALKSPCDFDGILYKTAWGIEKTLDSETFSATSLKENVPANAVLSKVSLELEESKKIFALKSPSDFDVTFDSSFGALDVSNRPKMELGVILYSYFEFE